MVFFQPLFSERSDAHSLHSTHRERTAACGMPRVSQFLTRNIQPPFIFHNIASWKQKELLA